ncbi:MAG: aminotransferase class III-fold pyridoxal phosphate-dependent enzyme [Ilumatobacteraceae bacterium]
MSPVPPTPLDRDPNRIQFVPGTAGPNIVGGDGCWLIAEGGRRILDAAGGAIVANIGHGRGVVADAVRDAIDGGAYVIPVWPTPHRARLHDALVERWLPDDMGHVFFTSGGSEAADSALRLARAYQVAVGRTDRWKVIGRHPSYHGITLGAMAVGSHAVRRAGYEPMLVDFPKVPWDDAAALADVIDREGAETIAAFLFEPITGAAGACLEPPDEYWRDVEAICRRNDILLIADEVMTGFGRTGTRWGHEHFPVRPDILYGGKGLGGGYVPIGMVSATDRVVDALRGSGFMFFTFTGCDAMCAGALAVLDVLEREHLVERCAAIGDVLDIRLREALGGHRSVVELRGRGLFRGIELQPDGGRFSAAVVAECLARDMWVYPAGSGPPVTDGIMIGCPFTISEPEVDVLVETLAAAIDAVSASR